MPLKEDAAVEYSLFYRALLQKSPIKETIFYQIVLEAAARGGANVQEFSKVCWLANFTLENGNRSDF